MLCLHELILTTLKTYIIILLKLSMEQIEDWKESIERRLKHLEYRIKELEAKRIASKIKGIEDSIKNTFLDMDNLKLLAYEIIDDAIRLIIVHNNDDKVKALNDANERLSKLEDKYQYIYFEPWIYHISEFDIKRDIKVIIKR